MLAAVVLFSVLTGAAGFGVMQWMGFSLWVSLLGYPVFGSIGLIGGAAFAAMGSQTIRPRAAITPLHATVTHARQAR